MHRLNLRSMTVVRISDHSSRKLRCLKTYWSPSVALLLLLQSFMVWKSMQYSAEWSRCLNVFQTSDLAHLWFQWPLKQDRKLCRHSWQPMTKPKELLTRQESVSLIIRKIKFFNNSGVSKMKWFFFSRIIYHQAFINIHNIG